MLFFVVLSYTLHCLIETNMFEGINRGIFGIPSGKKLEIESLVKQLESKNPTPEPTLELDKVISNFQFPLFIRSLSRF
jgi:hypothetical protein